MKPQNEKNKKKWTRPAWLNRIRLDKRTKVVCLFVAVMAGILFFLHQYNMRYIRSLQYAGTTVTDREVFAQLQQGTAEIGSAVWLPHFAANEPLYRRGSHYYIGEDYVRVQDGAPILVNDGTYVNLIGGDGTLIDADWTQLPAMAGMYLSNGNSFNYDGTMVDEEPILFFRMDNGLYVNTKSLAVYGLLQDVEIPTNSFLHIDENGIRYYARQDGEMLIYGSFTQIYEASVEIDGQRMSYVDFLIKLGIYQENEDFQKRQTEEPTETETVPEPEKNQGSEESSTSRPELSLEDLMESQQGEDNDGGDSRLSDGRGSMDFPDAGSDELSGDKDSNGDKDGLGDGSTSNGGVDDDEIPDRLPDNHRNNHNNDDLDNGNNNKGDISGGNNSSGGSGSETSGGNESGSGNESSGGNESGSGNESSGGNESGSGNESSGGNESGSGNESSGGNESGSGNESSGGNESGSGNESSGGNESGSGSETSGGNESGSGNESSGGNESGSGNETSGGNETDPSQETKPAESLPPATGSNVERPTLPVATDSNAGRPGEGEEGGEGGGEGSGDLPPYEIEWQKPQVTLSDLEMDVYSSTGSLEIEDPYGCFSKVILSMAWNDNLSPFDPNLETAVRYRKVLSGKGTFQVDNLPPGTKIFVAAYLQYYDRDGKKVRETEPFRTMVVKTRPFSEVDHICLSFSDNIAHSSKGQYYEKQAEVYDLYISGANGYLLDKVFRGEVRMYPEGDRETPITFRLSSSALKRYMNFSQDYTTLLSQGILEPNKAYRYEIELWDSFGNSFTKAKKVCWGTADRQSGSNYYKASGYDVTGNLYYPETGNAWNSSGTLGSQRFWGYTHTSKTMPKAVMEQIVIEDTHEALSEAKLSVKLEDIHQALITDSGTASGISGTPPKDGRGSYKIYLALYTQENGFDEGKEVPIAVTRKDDGTVAVNAKDSGSRFSYIENEGLPGKAGITYVVEGLTAGESYMLKVFGSYNLNDNQGNMYDRELGSLRFGTTSLAAYGRMYYTFTNRHIKTEGQEPQGVITYDHEKYESATAQELSMTINTKRTNPVLANEFFDRFYLELKERGTDEALIRLNFSKEEKDGLSGLWNQVLTVEDEKLNAEDGYYTYTLIGANANRPGDGKADYTYHLLSSKMNDAMAPKVEMRIPVGKLPLCQGLCERVQVDGKSATRFNLWYAFLSVEDGQSFSTERTDLVLTFGERSLDSITEYVLTAESYASQGAESNHQVTASSSTYYQRRFTTLKEMPYVTIGGVLQVGRYLYLVDVDFHDTDESIYQKKVMLRNVNTSRNNAASTKEMVLDYAVGSSGGRIAEASFDSLRMESVYNLEFVPVDIRRTGRTTAPRYQSEVLKIHSYTAGKGVVGNLFMMGISHPLDELTEEKNGKEIYHTAAEYSKYEIGNFQYGSMGFDGEGKFGIINRARNRQVMDPISVKEGQIYYLNRLNENNNSEVSLAFLDIDQNLINTIKAVPSNGYIKIPSGVSYMQISMVGNYMNYQAQVILVYDEEDNALKNKLQMVSGKKPVGSDGKTFTFNKEDLAKGDTIALVSGEWTSNDYINITCKSGGNTIDSGNRRSGYKFSIPEGTEELTVTVNTALKGSSGSSAVPDVRVVQSEKVEIFSRYFYEALIADYRVEVRDYNGKNGSLQDKDSGGVRVVVKAFDRDGKEVSAPENAGLDEHADSNGSYNKAKSFETETGYIYHLYLEICWRGKWYPLDQQEFEATESEYSIASGNQLLKLNAWPFGKFRVIADLGDIDPFTLQNLKDVVGIYGTPGSFGGTMNGQGHSMTVDISGSAYSNFLNIGDNGKIENLELTVNLGNGKDPMWELRPINSNYGEIRNIVLYVDTKIGNLRHEESAGLCNSNYGLIENFALYYKYSSDSSGTYMGSYFGGLTVRNSGTIRNGVVYGARAIDVTTGIYGGTTDIGISNVGGVVGENLSTGVVEQILSILTMRVEQNAYVTDSTKTMGSYGVIVGGNRGTVRNCFTSGEMYYRYWEPKTSDNKTQARIRPANTNIAWPGCNSSTSPGVKNCYYFSTGQYKVSNANVRHLLSRSALRSPQFYGNTINRDNGFVVESQLSGEYYPIVNMPAYMDGKQQNISLNSTAPGSIPSYISSAVIRNNSEEMLYLEDQELPAETVKKIQEIITNASLAKEFLNIKDDGTAVVTKQFALVDVVFSNRNDYKIEELEIEGLTADTLSMETSEGLSVIKTLVTPYVRINSGGWTLSTFESAYTASHAIKSFKYGYADNLTTTNVADESINLDFYYPLSYETWTDRIPRNKNTNYRLREDIHFAEGTGKFGSIGAVISALNSFNEDKSESVEGIFDGGGHTLNFEGVAAAQFRRPYIFKEIGVGGVVKNLDIENLTLSDPNNINRMGLIRDAKGRSVLSDIHMRNITLDGVHQYAGSLVAVSESNTIVNCTVAGAQITSDERALDLYVGGMVGSRSYQSNMENSFIRGLKMDIRKGYSVKASGGLVGRDIATTSGRIWLYPIITSCYAEGSINTAFANAGGMVGNGNTRITNAWSAVDIVGTNRVGSLIGYAASYGNSQINSYAGVVVSGELYASSEGIERRMVGFWQRERSQKLTSRIYAYKEQLLNSNTSTDIMDTTTLTDLETMKQPQFWSETAAIGKYFHLTGTDKADGTRIPGVSEAGVYPILYRNDGVTLLPDQEAVYYDIARPKFEVISAVAEDKGTARDPYGEYELTFTVEIEGKLSENEVENIKLNADGLDFTNAKYVSDLSGENTKITITDVKADRRLDSYRLSYEYVDKVSGRTGTVSTKLAFKDKAGNDMYLFWKIKDAAAWKAKLIDEERGFNYENFMIYGDINLQSNNDAQLKLNRLQGALKTGWNEGAYDYRSREWKDKPEFYQLYNINMTGKNTAWIAEISNYMGYLDIRNCSISGGSPVSNFGFVGTINGDVEYVDFYNNRVETANALSGSYSNIGCLGNVQGRIYRSRGCDLQVTLQSGTGFRYGNVGGIAGYTRELEQAAVFGTKYNPDRHDSANSYRISMGAERSVVDVSNFGGIVGYVYIGAHNLYGENLDIYGVSSTGALLGGTEPVTKGEQIKNYFNAEVRSCRVTGRTNVGGAFGWARSANYVRVMGAAVESSNSNGSGNSTVGGVTGSADGVSYGEVYGSTIKGVGNYAGGITGSSYGVSNSKVANCTVEAGGNRAGGIAGGDYCMAASCAVYNTTVSGQSYVGGILGLNTNRINYYSQRDIYENVVSKVEVKGSGSCVGGIVGRTAGAAVYANEVKADVTVTGHSDCGGLAGYSSGGSLYHNIIGGTVTGTSYVGGLVGEILGFGEPPVAGTTMNHRPAKVYGNLIVCKQITADISYLGGLIGAYEIGTQPVDGDGNPIEGLGYISYMSSADFYGNAIFPDNMTLSTMASSMNYYANYKTGRDQYYLDRLIKENELPNYDCILSSMKDWNIYGRFGVPNPEDGTEVKQGVVVAVSSDALKSEAFYTDSNEEGGLGLGTQNFDYADIKNTPVAYYPYIKKRINNNVSYLMPYQNNDECLMGGTEDWNTYYVQSDTTWSSERYDGTDRIPIPAVTSRMNLRSVARGMVYPSGPDTINIDFSRVDNSLVNFDIEGEEGYLEKTSIEAVKDKAGVCSMTYDYQTDFVLNLYSLDSSVKESYVYYADNLRRTVMSWNGKNYYILSDGIYQGMEDGTSKKVLDGEFVNLYQGAALDSEGKVHQLAPSAAPKKVKKAEAEEELEEILSSVEAQAEEDSEEIQSTVQAEEEQDKILPSDETGEASEDRNPLIAQPEGNPPAAQPEESNEQEAENEVLPAQDSQSE